MNAYMTSDKHDTPTSRLHEISTKIDADLYIMINGDEPLIEPETIDSVIPDSLPPGKLYIARVTRR